MGARLGDLFYLLNKHRRQLALKNLEIAFGATHSPAERIAIARAAYRNLGKSIVEIIRFPKLDIAYLKTKITVIGIENLLEAKNKGRGIIYLAAHFGNWELMSLAHAANGYPATIVGRPLDNPFLDRWILSLRTFFGHKTLTTRKSLREMIRAIKNKESLAVLMDQNTTKSAGIFVDFFGRSACTTPVIALLASKYDVPVIPVYIVRNGFDQHTVYFEKEPILQKTDDVDADLKTNTAALTKILETWIRRHPDHWFWIHNRWKTRP
jgi:KDO2-lipid IV(A) lauroyltransferase